MRVAVIGGGWAGMAAAVHATEAGHTVDVYEAARQLGGRARAVPLVLPDGREVRVDNGQHILIGAYSECLQLMRRVGVDPAQALLRLPLALRQPSGQGLALPDWPAPLDVLAGIASARGWRWRDKWALLRTAFSWQRAGFACPPHTSVADLCAGLSPQLCADFIEPLCVSALNTPMREASGQVFLRVLRDALFAERGGSNLLLPRTDLGRLFPEPAAAWLEQRGARVYTGCRVQTLRWQTPHWCVGDQAYERLILATSASHAVQLLVASAQHTPAPLAHALHGWCHRAAALQHRPITTVYAQIHAQRQEPVRLSAPMLALPSSPEAPAQFVFDRDAITQAPEPSRLLAFVISDSDPQATPGALAQAVTAQARAQLGLTVSPLRTITEKRATFACTPALRRPPMHIASGLLAAGDYIAGPYPATLEGAVRSAREAAEALA